MSQNLGNLTLVNGNNSFSTPSTGLQGFILANNSGYNLVVTLDGTGYTKNLYPNTADFFPMLGGYTGTIKIVASAMLANVSSFAGNFLQVDAIGPQESINVSSFPVTLAPPAVSSSGTGNPNYSAYARFINTTTSLQALNVFNPKTSGKKYEFYSARLFTTDATTPLGELFYFTGDDNNLANNIPTVCHTIGGPASASNSTYSDGVGGNNTGNFELLDMPANTLIDLLAFPDKVVAPPGNNVELLINSGVTGKNVTMILKWNESQI